MRSALSRRASRTALEEIAFGLRSIINDRSVCGSFRDTKKVGGLQGGNLREENP